MTMNLWSAPNNDPLAARPRTNGQPLIHPTGYGRDFLTAVAQIRSLKVKRDDLEARHGHQHPGLAEIEDEVELINQRLDAIATRIRQAPMTMNNLIDLTILAANDCTLLDGKWTSGEGNDNIDALITVILQLADLDPKVAMT